MVSSSGNTNYSPIYGKALEILHLARRISHYLGHDLSRLQKDGSEDPHIYFTGDIIQQSVSLGPEILKAESHLFQEERLKYIASVKQLSNRIYKNCRRLQQANSNGKDFIPILLKELRKFRKLIHVWQLTQ